MMTPPPQNISREELFQRLQREITYLTDSNLAWWTDHRVPPFAARHWDISHFVVAVAGEDVVFFADDEEEFGIAKWARSSQVMTECGLVGDLTDAVQVMQRFAVEPGRLPATEPAYSVY